MLIPGHGCATLASAWALLRQRAMRCMCGAAGALCLGQLPPAHAATPPGAAPANDSPEPQFAAEIAHNLSTAQWMVAYDQVAWKTTDLLLKEDKATLKKIGPIWFCFEQDQAWYAVYGSDQAQQYVVAVCYRQTAPGTFKKTVPPAFADQETFARVLRRTLPSIQELTRRTSVRFNYYIRREAGGVAVYFLPAFQTDGRLAYGIQEADFFDGTGSTLLAQEKHGATLIGAIPTKARTLVLEMTDCAVPTPQALFTMISYRDQFEDLLTQCQNGYYGVKTLAGRVTVVRATAPSTPFFSSAPP